MCVPGEVCWALLRWLLLQQRHPHKSVRKTRSSSFRDSEQQGVCEPGDHSLSLGERVALVLGGARMDGHPAPAAVRGAAQKWLRMLF